MASKLKAKKPVLGGSRPRFKSVVFGKPGVGKTWVSLDCPVVYYIDSEAGATRDHYKEKLIASGGVYMGTEDGARDFVEVLGQVKALATEAHPYRTLVIDSLSKIGNHETANELERIGGDKVVNTYAAEKRLATSHTRQLVNWIDRLDMNVILICHAKGEWGMDDKGNRVEIGITFDAWDKIEYELDLCLYVAKNGPVRTARVRKTRIEEFKEGDVFPWTYQEFAKRYGQDILERQAEPVVLINQSQLDALNALLENRKDANAWLNKCLTSAKADTIADLSSSHAEAMIASLKKGEKA